VPKTQGKILYYDIPNAALELAENKEFRAENPAKGIANILVTQASSTYVRVQIVGAEGLPTGKLVTNERGLVITPVAGAPVAEDEEQDEVEILVTATREQIEEQTRLSRNLTDILSKTVPGFSPPTNRSNSFGTTFRGREGISVVIDGIPQNTNLIAIPGELSTIDPGSIERIEIIRGPNAIYGGQATGGLINIITRKPTDRKLTSTLEVGLNSPLTGSEDNLGNNFRFQISGKENIFDFVGAFSRTRIGAFYDAQGDRIPSEYVNADATELNALLKLGVDIAPQQRLQFSLNHFDRRLDNRIISDIAIDNTPGIQKARAIRTPAGTQVIGAADDRAYLRSTNTTLVYTHEDLLSSRFSGQLYYRKYAFQGSGIPVDARDFLGIIYQSPGETEQIGGRLQFETTFNPEKTLSLLWGADYLNERSASNFNIFDPVEFDASGGLIYRKINEATFVPPYSIRDLGLFAQLKWQVDDRTILSGGARYVSLNANVNDYTSFDNVSVKGGNLSASDIVFNAGIVYKLTNELSLFTSFSQGFSFPDIGGILRFPAQGFSVSSSIDLTQPQKVNNYELGIRGNWDALQFSLAGFFNISDLGVDFVNLDNGRFRTVRAPSRVYGIEATVDWKPAEQWKLGATLSWLEGENDEGGDGSFLALNSLLIPPLKLTAYVENETLPGWRNRLQLLYSGNRDRAFNNGIDGAPIRDYITFDLLSTIKLSTTSELQIAIQNLFNAQYFPVYSQYFAPIFDSSNYAGQGRTVSVSYRLSF
jgi:iron complex outermembrane receptor protein